MAHVKKGLLTAPGEWRKHLRFLKKFYWHAERREARRQAQQEAKARPPRRAFDFPAMFIPAPRWQSDYRPTPLLFSAPPISSKIAGSSMVAGMVQGSPSAIFLMVPRRILPERVFGSR